MARERLLFLAQSSAPEIDCVGTMPDSQLLLPALDNAFWRSQETLRFRDREGFSKKKGHFEPEDHSSHASKWAEELTRAESAEEIRQIYENAVVILGNRRSQMERSDRDFECAQLRFQSQAVQHPTEPDQILITRLLWLKKELSELPEHFDDLFPYKPCELIVPVSGVADRREILIALEDWEQALKAKLEESADQLIYKLTFRSGLVLSVDIGRRETSFSKRGVEGVYALASGIALDLKGLKIPKQLL